MSRSTYAEFDFETAIRQRSARSGLGVSAVAVAALAEHARSVLRHNDVLHLTSITEPGEFVERHLGESFEGAALLPPDVGGTLVDLGSGNGYPGLPVAAARPGLAPVLVEASQKKAAFLRTLSSIDGLPAAAVHTGQVQRASDLLEPLGGRQISVLVTRAMGNWERLLPRLVAALREDAHVLLWAGETAGPVSRRAAWRRLELVRRQPLPERERSWIWVFAPRPASG